MRLALALMTLATTLEKDAGNDERVLCPLCPLCPHDVSTVPDRDIKEVDVDQLPQM